MPCSLFCRSSSTHRTFLAWLGHEFFRRFWSRILRLLSLLTPDLGGFLLRSGRYIYSLSHSHAGGGMREAVASAHLSSQGVGDVCADEEDGQPQGRNARDGCIESCHC